TSFNSGATTFNYWPNGMRARKSTGGNYKEYIYFGGLAIAEKDQSGAWTDYIFAGGQRIAKATGSSTSNTEYYHGDHLGSTRLLTGSAGTQTWSATYLPFGFEFNTQGTTNTYKFAD